MAGSSIRNLLLGAVAADGITVGQRGMYVREEQARLCVDGS